MDIYAYICYIWLETDSLFASVLAVCAKLCLQTVAYSSMFQDAISTFSSKHAYSLK